MGIAGIVEHRGCVFVYFLFVFIYYCCYGALEELSVAVAIAVVCGRYPRFRVIDARLLAIVKPDTAF